MKENNRRTFGRAAWVGKAVLFCLGVLAMVALVVVVAVLAAVMLADTVLPAAVTGHERNPGVQAIRWEHTETLATSQDGCFAGAARTVSRSSTSRRSRTI